MPTTTLGLTRSVRVGYGRRLTISVAGPEDGFPCVYCHGAIGSPRWRIPQLDVLLDRIGIRYVVVNRPGFGGSDSCPGRRVVEFGEDLETVMAGLGHDRFAVVGVSAGAPYALASGWTSPEMVTAVAAVSPLAPAIGAGASQGRRYKVPTAAFGMPRLGPAFGSFCLHALRLQGQTSSEAMLEDYRVCRRAWGFDLDALRVPVTIWHGRADRLVPLRHALRLAWVIPGATIHVDPKGGHFFYGRRLEEIVGALVRGVVNEPVVEASELLRAA